MPDNELNFVVRNFKVNVSKTGVFSYDPPATWLYGRGDFVRFNSDTGPFEITFLPDNGEPPQSQQSPFGGAGLPTFTSNNEPPYETPQFRVVIPNPSDLSVKNPPVRYKYQITMSRKDKPGQAFNNNAGHGGGIDC
jgi:hypothetical protein